MPQQSVATADDFMDLLRHEHSEPFAQPVKPQRQPQTADVYAETYAALRREFDADLYGRVSLKRIAALSR
jgi:hypothetical protein